MFQHRINEDDDLEAVSPRRCQGRGCSRGLNLDGEKGWAHFFIYFGEQWIDQRMMKICVFARADDACAEKSE